ncbi:U3 small nucleolar RNA-associated protein 11 [Tothia fuscella]|uniref:U3 small nucleolar RNA-associated protein 11 n=1 Tax=Tothia fuscella TaxID=1048955 RepID=A0A9P4NRW3_9PEZI|nr:U3 small nucleolar RNA-associated protein 11 [Tothia fuscella]
MSSMRNAVQRRNHKERAQPVERQKWGILEKHKDYALRAKDHKEKRRRIKVLKEKAAFRNPDEFHFGMMSSRMQNGVKVGDRGNTALSNNVVQLMKTQDVGYLRTMLQKSRKERLRLEEEIFVGDEAEMGMGMGKVKALRGGEVGGRKIAFVESVDEQEAFLPEDEDEWESEGEDEDEEDAPTPRKFAKPGDAEAEAAKRAHFAKKKRLRGREVRQTLLEAVKEREDELSIAIQELELQLAKMSNSVGGVNKSGVKFKVRERKR